MEPLQLKLNGAINSIKLAWNNQSKPKKYIAIIAVSIPSLVILRNLYWYMYRKYHSLPPGPNGVPFLGIIPKWTAGAQSRINLSKQYGPIFYTSFIGGVPMIILSSSKLVKQILPQKQFLDRNAFKIYDPQNTYHPSIGLFGKSHTPTLILVDGENWRKRRKLSQDSLFKILNNETVGKLLKATFETEVKPYLEDIINSNKAWYSREIFEYISLNTIYSTAVGKNLERNSVLFRKLRNYLDDTMKYLWLDFMVMTIPFMTYFFGDKLDKFKHERDGTTMQIIIEATDSRNKNDNNNKSYLDYSHEMVINGELTQDQEIADTFQLFIAGMDTTSSTLEMGVALLAKNKDIQNKIRNELLDIMGKEYNIKLINKCHLFRAAVHEILRLSSVAFMGVFRSSSKDYWIELDDGKKYKIPANTLINYNTDYIHIYGENRNENWKRTNEDEIILENWLTKDDDGGIRFVMNESFIAFSVGKRDCVGRQLAMKELYYTLGYLLINYKVSFWNKEDQNKDITLIRSVTQSTAFLDPAIPIKIETL